jgi:glycosyltransferase involved in cell wall biosynthesis
LSWPKEVCSRIHDTVPRFDGLLNPTMQPLRIGINALYLIPGGVGGTEIYLHCLLKALAAIDSVDSFLVFAGREAGGDLAPPAENFRTLVQPIRSANRPARLLWEQTGLPLMLEREGIDVLLNPGFTAPLACPCPQVTVFHDLQHKRHPEHFRWFDLPFWNFFLFWSARVSQIVLAASPPSAADLKHFYRLPESRIRVVGLGTDERCFGIAAERRPEPFLLTVSTLHPHKNLDRLLRAFAVFRANHPKFRLVVTGLHGFAARELMALRDELGLGQEVDFPGWVPRQDLYDLYTRAWAFVYPSTFEGFGMPVTEALAAGIPSACSAVEPLATIAGDAALQFAPEDTAALALAMERLACDDDLRRRLAAAGPIQATRYSWRTTAEQTLAALRQVAER